MKRPRSSVVLRGGDVHQEFSTRFKEGGAELSLDSAVGAAAADGSGCGAYAAGPCGSFEGARRSGPQPKDPDDGDEVTERAPAVLEPAAASTPGGIAPEQRGATAGSPSQLLPWRRVPARRRARVPIGQAAAVSIGPVLTVAPAAAARGPLGHGVGRAAVAPAGDFHAQLVRLQQSILAAAAASGTGAEGRSSRGGGVSSGAVGTPADAQPTSSGESGDGAWRVGAPHSGPAARPSAWQPAARGAAAAPARVQRPAVSRPQALASDEAEDDDEAANLLIALASEAAAEQQRRAQHTPAAAPPPRPSTPAVTQPHAAPAAAGSTAAGPRQQAGIHNAAKPLTPEVAAQLLDSADGLKVLAASLPPAAFIALVERHEAVEKAQRTAAAADAAVRAVEGVLETRRAEAAAAAGSAAVAARALAGALAALPAVAVVSPSAAPAGSA